MWASIGREGTNAPVQGGNGDLIKLAMGCGFDSNGKPFLWHTLEPELGGKIVNLVHDELVIEGPEENAEKINLMAQDCIERAGAEIYKKVQMKSDGCVATCWQKD
jgi:DNA polymerase-1